LICDASDDSCYSYDFKSNQNVSCVEWISRNQLICGYVKGTAEIHEIELSAKSTSKLIKKLVVSARVSHESRTRQTHTVCQKDIWVIMFRVSSGTKN
jgi:hypothetical protein